MHSLKEVNLRFSHRFPFLKIRDNLKIKFAIPLFRNHQTEHILKFPEKDLYFKLDNTIMFWFTRITFKKHSVLK